MQLHITFFGVLKQDTGTKQHTLDVTDDTLTLREAVALLKQQYPVLEGRLATVAYAVNDEFARPDQTLHHGDRIALLPPVSGG